MVRTARKSSSKPARRTRAKAAPKTATHKLVWRHASCRVRHTRDYISKGWSHIELTVISPRGAPLPITSTGYLSHFLDEADLAAAGGPFLAWLDREAASKAWHRAEFAWRQGDLFAT
ncbi:MAG TPA: hypothetical protein PK264_10955 [Hyphomicrobiaceae bacterium]|nr:hypothetical protein [Hyphomicrobiaceae bacterium]